VEARVKFGHESGICPTWRVLTGAKGGLVRVGGTSLGSLRVITVAVINEVVVVGLY
jgi:hypothetical protein